MVTLGIYVAKDGKKYDCRFLPDYKLAFAIGPLPEPENGAVSRGIVAEVFADSEESARRNLNKVIGEGSFE